MGCDHTIDYLETDFTRTVKEYDLILDMKTTRSAFAYIGALKPGGTYVTVGGSMPRVLQIFLLSGLVSTTINRNLRVLGLKANRGLAEIAPFFESGGMLPIVDGPYPLCQVPEALKRFSNAEQIGRIVISMPANEGV
ncbi:MAG: zinc-binding dehydrogenase [Acidobacteriota bacterium]|nr:zinc-binding dehydrogenase [Acidobacteriota bacterium]